MPSEQSASRVRLTPVQRELLEEFQASGSDERGWDRHVRPRYERSAAALVRAGFFRRLTGGWYEITPKGRSYRV